MRRPCVECHAGATSSAQAGFPKAEACQKCHGADNATTPAAKAVSAWPPQFSFNPAQRLYKNKDYVVFSHAAHAKGGASCTNCHGEVYRMDRMVKFMDTSMKACVDCHKQRKAPLDCNLCHDLGM